MVLTRDYLDQHQLQQRIQTLIQDVLREQPDNPYKYMLEQLRKAQASGGSLPSKEPGSVGKPRMQDSRSELSQLRQGELQRRARVVGVSDAEIDDAIEQGNAKAALIELILARQPQEALSPKAKTPEARAPESKTPEQKAPLAPRAPDKPKPDQPRGRSAQNTKAMENSPPKLMLGLPGQAPRPSPEVLTEARAAANFSVIQMLRGPACRKAADHSLRDNVRRGMAESMSLMVLNSVKEKMVAEVSSSKNNRALARVSCRACFQNAAVYCSPEYNRALTMWAAHMAYKGSCALLGFSSRRASRAGEENRRMSMPTPIVFLETDKAGWGSWLRT
jgi:hypothetical protein